MTDQDLRNLARVVLTPRQLEVWQLIEGGMSQRQVSIAVGIGRGTVRDHLDAAAARLRANGAPA